MENDIIDERFTGPDFWKLADVVANAIVIIGRNEDAEVRAKLLHAFVHRVIETALREKTDYKFLIDVATSIFEFTHKELCRRRLELQQAKEQASTEIVAEQSRDPRKQWQRPNSR